MSGPESKSQSVKSDETLFAIVECVQDSERAGVTEIAQTLELAKSTVHKHLATLEQHGYVVNEGGTYRPGLQFFGDGIDVRNQYDVFHAAKDRVDMLAAETDEAVWLVVHENGRVMFLYGSVKNNTFNSHSVVGQWKHLHSTSGGKAILAHLPEQTVHELTARDDLPSHTENTITDRAELEEQLEEVRATGVAWNRKEDFTGVHAIAAPIILDGEPIAAITIAGAASRLTEEYCETQLRDPLLEAVNDVELRLAYD
ncbi:IclR family transcriptional regulator [Halostagnicola sp. A-GB9-2]|uniref:IclR family transcriptional regulator n=1 Tax=Halostagnicola sp. A-GB9-2 TaxID=3048066 RepID=UPI0024C0BF6F|nr:IclR family transcriptional regulator [Halostagnicola sp. A-GB9-2]MDJ1433077.1 IclR family transcriptional regulator [Halostagnicola sp. A-GB9-2]